MLQLLVNDLPKSPGVYLFRDLRGGVIYVGKAANLQSRVRSYFQPAADLGPKTRLMVAQISRIDHFETETEFDALLLESDLIKRLRPKYNQRLKDDKSYPLIAVTKETFPQVLVMRNKGAKAEYFGPYPQGDLRRVLKLLHRAIPFRDCSSAKFSRYQKLGRGCLYADLNLCSAPCIGAISEEDYRRQILRLKSFLRGRGKAIIKKVETAMRRAAKDQDYEKAARLRDEIRRLEYVSRGFRSSPASAVNVNLPEDQAEQVLTELQGFLGLVAIPRRIEGYDISNIQGKYATGSMVVFEDGRPNKNHYRRFKIRAAGEPDDCLMMAEVLDRRFSRDSRFQKSKDQKEGSADASFESIPNLILVDGGKGQLSAARAVFMELGLEIPVVALAKREEKVYFCNGIVAAASYAASEQEVAGPIRLPRNSKALQLLQRVRDEAHRFAIGYHRKLREKL